MENTTVTCNKVTSSSTSDIAKVPDMDPKLPHLEAKDKVPTITHFTNNLRWLRRVTDMHSDKHSLVAQYNWDKGDDRQKKAIAEMRAAMERWQELDRQVKNALKQYVFAASLCEPDGTSWSDKIDGKK